MSARFLFQNSFISAPEEPKDLKVLNITEEHFLVSWSPPEHPNGVISAYKIIIYLNKLNYDSTISSDCPLLDNSIKTIAVNDTTYLFNYTYPFAEYGVKVAAINAISAGNYSDIILVKTPPNKPQPARYLNVKLKNYPEVDKDYNATVKITWENPCLSNGIVEKFRILFNGVREGHEDHQFVWESEENKMTDFSMEESRMKPEYSYKIDLFVKVQNFDEFSEPITIEYTSPSGSK